MTNHKGLKRLFTAVVLTFVISLGGTTVLPFETVQVASAASKSSRVVSAAKQYLGTPYKFGASTKTTRVFDCSSFTKRVYGKVGITLPRTSIKQSKVGRYVSKSNLRVGDLVFFYSPIHHVGIYIGGGKIIHTYGKPGVTISTIKSGWWKKHYKTARRVL
ncbi:C40 family peptidase [Paenibacillus beijingensis]|uniref:Hydrolase n=1 Tax=Paenibacillus beijingensis TaxID=1126833 RepID=A0A0D5NJR4_9BACL|nr:C40 family peptidase [Paenibacillus beijingensis]AJY75511.1 hydrolase [Paenibacillus beijingensis]